MGQHAFQTRIDVNDEAPAALLIDALEVVDEMLSAVVEFLKGRYGRNALFTLSITHPQLEKPLRTTTYELHTAADRATEDLLFMAVNVTNSRQDVPLDENLIIYAMVLQRPRIRLAGRYAASKWTLYLESLPGLHRVPELAPPYRQCCLLIAVQMGMILNEFLREPNDAVKRRNWNLIKDMRKGRRVEMGLDYLTKRLQETCRIYNLNPDDYANCNYEVAGRLSRALKDVNLIFYLASGGFRRFGQYPKSFNKKREAINILLAAPPPLGKKQIDDDDGDTTHCVLISDSNLFYKRVKVRQCFFCYKMYAPDYFKFHRCNAARSCNGCYTRLRRIYEYADCRVEKESCLGDAFGVATMTCQKCKTGVYGAQCLRKHKIMCGKRSLSRCDACQKIVRNRDAHQCGVSWCRNCKRNTTDDDHRCLMERPNMPRYYRRLAFYDTETRIDEKGRHRVNAVGASYEERDFEQFREVCFYDEDLQHGMDGVLSETLTKVAYWPEAGVDDDKKQRWAGDKSKTKKSNFADGFGESDKLAEDFFADAEATSECDDNEDETRVPAEEEEDFSDNSALVKFVKYFMNDSFRDYTFVAHNGAKFDHILLLRVLLRRNIRVRPLIDGNKVLYMALPELGIRFIDSYRYIQMPLAAFEKRFPQAEGCRGGKGLFPYAFNLRENYGYESDAPPLEEHYVDRFSTAEKIAAVREYIRSWPSTAKWNFRREIDAYLRLDVRILRDGCLALLKEYFDFQVEYLGGAEAAAQYLNDRAKEGKGKKPALFHCFTNFFTNSQFVHALWRHYEMKDGDIYLLDNQRQSRKTSKYERELLAYLDFELPALKLRTAFNHPLGQTNIGKYALDGYALATGTAFEFLGCSIHGHCVESDDCAFADQSAGGVNPYGVPYITAYRRWREKRKFLSEQPEVKSIVHVWECEYLRWRESATTSLSADPHERRLGQFLDDFYAGGRPKERLALRDALRGGRTEGFRLWWDKSVEKNRRLYYIDKNSLYPTMAIAHEFPVGEPAYLIGARAEKVEWKEGLGFQLDGENLIGLIQCTVLPPDAIYLPALPARIRGKLFFGLCARCMNENLTSLCRHSNRDRQITDTWTTAEVHYALERCDYKLVRVHEMVVFPRRAPIFRNFYTRLAKIKLASEGFPSNCDTEERRLNYVLGLNEAMPNLNLKIDDVSRNPGRRQFAKQVSNIGLGKFSQDDERANVVYVANWIELARIYYNQNNEFLEAVPITPTWAEVRYRPKSAKIGFHRNVHVVVYSFVTAYARIAMMNDMKTLQQRGARIFYTDTGESIRVERRPRLKNVSLFCRFHYFRRAGRRGIVAPFSGDGIFHGQSGSRRV